MGRLSSMKLFKKKDDGSQQLRMEESVLHGASRSRGRRSPTGLSSSLTSQANVYGGSSTSPTSASMTYGSGGGYGAATPSFRNLDAGELEEKKRRKSAAIKAQAQRAREMRLQMQAEQEERQRQEALEREKRLAAMAEDERQREVAAKKAEEERAEREYQARVERRQRQEAEDQAMKNRIKMERQQREQRTREAERERARRQQEEQLRAVREARAAQGRDSNLDGSMDLSQVNGYSEASRGSEMARKKRAIARIMKDKTLTGAEKQQRIRDIQQGGDIDDSEASGRSGGGGRRDSAVAILEMSTKLQINMGYSSVLGMSFAPRVVKWLSSFYRLDPRYQILKYFNDVAQQGAVPIDTKSPAIGLLKAFSKANVFTVWRPTSTESIRNMMRGAATGKGLDIKGKSAKRGNISSYVPFIQIYDEPHKEYIRTYIKDGKTIRVYYATEAARDEAAGMLQDMKEFMLFAAEDAMRVLSDEFADPAEQDLAMKHLMYDDTSLRLSPLDGFVPHAYGLDITERLFWEAYVMMQDCNRVPGTPFDTGRPSEPAFMDMNFKAIRHKHEPGTPRPVVWQMSTDSPMEPRTLLMAYEENGKVMPVVSDFDCFIMGTRGVKYREPLPPVQVDLVKWQIENIKKILDGELQEAGWTKRWLDVLKKAALKGFYPEMPRFGFGDPQSYSIMGCAVDRLSQNGCVRHGAECFNYYFPQELDEEFLVISDTLEGNVPWKYVNVRELQEILCQKIDEGFTFPINPKWVLCDPGWKPVYTKLLASQRLNVQDALNVWFPPDSGIRESIEEITTAHPEGFQRKKRLDMHASMKFDGTEQMDFALNDLQRFVTIERAKKKLRAAIIFMRLLKKSNPEEPGKPKAIEHGKPPATEEAKVEEEKVEEE